MFKFHSSFGAQCLAWKKAMYVIGKRSEETVAPNYWMGMPVIELSSKRGHMDAAASNGRYCTVWKINA